MYLETFLYRRQMEISRYLCFTYPSFSRGHLNNELLCLDLEESVNQVPLSASYPAPPATATHAHRKGLKLFPSISAPPETQAQSRFCSSLTLHSWLRTPQLSALAFLLCSADMVKVFMEVGDTAP